MQFYYPLSKECIALKTIPDYSWLVSGFMCVNNLINHNRISPSKISTYSKKCVLSSKYSTL